MLLSALSIVGICLLSSCAGRNYLVVPHSVSSASAVTVDDLRLQKGDYDVLRSITETASVLCQYSSNKIVISGDNGAFAYVFSLSKNGWKLDKFAGAANMGYFTSDVINLQNSNEIPNAEEFARRVAMARIIRAAKDYKADAVVEPVVISSANNVGKNKIEYVATVSAKLVSIKTTL